MLRVKTAHTFQSSSRCPSARRLVGVAVARVPEDLAAPRPPSAHRRCVNALLLVALLALTACERGDPFIVGPTATYWSGPTGFVASPIWFKGRSLGYASAHPPPSKVGSRYWVYRSCDLSRREPGFDGRCGEWRILDSESGAVQPMELPGLDSFWSEPGFLWPYVAYVQVGKITNKGNQTVHCALLHYGARKIVRRVRANVPGYTFGTDVEGTFSAPAFVEENGKTVAVFAIARDDQSRQPLCKIQVP